MATDDELKEMERYLRKQYQRAGKEVLETAEKYFKKFESLDKSKKRLVEEGKLTEEEYQTWRKNKILYGEHWDRLLSQITGELYKTNQAAAAYVEGKSVKIFTENYNLIEKEIPDVPVKGYTFELVNEETVRQLATTGELMLPPPNPPDKYKDNKWNAKQVHAEVLQGILQGDSMNKIASRLLNTVDKNHTSAIRNARTMVTAAENSGRKSGLDKAEADGIIFKKEWIATIGDGRTRETHLAINGELVDNGELFSNGCEFPGDWRAEPCEVYNCRCTLATKFVGFNKKKLEEAAEKQEELREAEQSAKNIDSVSTVEEVTDMLRNSGWFRTSDKANNLEGVDIESAKMIYTTYEKLFDKYPFLKEKFLGVMSEGAKESQFACASRNMIYVNTVWFSDYNNMRDEYLYSVATKFHTKGTDVDSILVHEFGHNIDMFIAEVFERSSYYESTTFKRKVMGKFDKNISIRKEVSGYAEKNPQEWFAECFAEYFCSEEPRRVAKAFGEEFEKLLEKAEKEYNKKVEKAKQKTRIKLGG